MFFTGFDTHGYFFFYFINLLKNENSENKCRRNFQLNYFEAMINCVYIPMPQPLRAMNMKYLGRSD